MQVRTETDGDYSETVFDDLVAVVKYDGRGVAEVLNARMASRVEVERTIAALTAALTVLV